MANAVRLLAAAGVGLATVVGAISGGADGAAAGCAPAKRICKSLASRRLSFHGKFKPGSPNVWPPSVMLNKSV